MEVRVGSSGLVGSNNVNENFEKVSMDIFNYIELGLISAVDLKLYIKILQLYNHEYGYAFPTVNQLMLMTNTRSKATVHGSLNNLEEIGLLRKTKGNKGNNLYVPFVPLTKHELYKQVPDLVGDFEKKKEEMKLIADTEKVRLLQHQINMENLVRKSEDMNAKTITPKER